MQNSLTLLKDLIKIESISGGEQQVAKFIADWLKSNNIKTMKVGNNVAVVIRGKDSKRALIFNGHIDTVSPGNLDSWNTNPFELTEIGDKMYGLGTSDMKGGVTAMLLLAKDLIEKQPPIDIWLAFVVKEELDGSGSEKFVEWFVKNNKYQQVVAIIGDTTGLIEIEIGHKGNAFVKTKFICQSGHGSDPNRIKLQAILEANKFINKMNKKLKEWEEKYKDKYLGVPSVAITGISSGDLESPNKIPGKCIIQLDIRTTPKLHQKLKMELDKWLGDYELVADPAACGWCEPEEKIVKVAQKVAPTAKLTCSMGATDQCFFSQMGIPAVIFGPGEKSVAHQENEWIRMGEIEKFVETYEKIINLYGSNL